MTKLRSQAGFTLIELMITVVVVAILAAIAFPSYTKYVARGNRSEGQAMLNDAAARMERYSAQNNGYTTDITKLGFSNPQLSPQKYYALTLSTDSTQTNSTKYKFLATPQNGQANNDTDCLILSIDETGLKTATGPLATTCWN